MISVTSQEYKTTGVKLPDIQQTRLQKIGSAKSCRVLDLCCGLGGLSLAGQNLGMEIVAGVDLNAAALRTFEKNFPQAEALEGSVRSSKILKRCSALLKPSGENSSSVIVSGPPCQGFSVAGSRDPVDPRNQILIAVARAIVLMQPDCALIENVSMVLADDHGKRLGQLERNLAEGGYHVLRVLLNAADYGVAQRRKRAFFLISRSPFDPVEVDARLTKLKQPLITSKAALRGLPVPNIFADPRQIPRHWT